MKSKKVFLLTLSCCVLMFPFRSSAQKPGYVKQVVTANSGKFEFSPPYSDYVSLQSFNPQTSQKNIFDTIHTQSAQSILISGHIAFFCAQDSIVKYDLNKLKRMAAIADSGLNRMEMYKGKLLVSKQYPVNQHFLEVLDTANLSLVAEVSGISGDCGGICSLNDTVYVAVNGGYLGTEGKLAIVDPVSWTLKKELNFGQEAIGIWDLYPYNGKIITINKTPYGVVDTGSVTVYTPSNRNFNNVFIPKRIFAGSGVKDSLLYLGIGYGIGSFNLNTLTIADTTIVKDPGLSVYTFIISSAIDTLDGRIYTNIGDYQTPGYCLVTSLAGDSITTYATGISSDAIAIDTRTYGAGINDNPGTGIVVNLYPNPVRDQLKISFNHDIRITSLSVTDLSGREMMNIRPWEASGREFELPVNSLATGLYYLLIGMPDGRIVKQFAVIKN